MSKPDDVKFLKIQTCVLKVNIHCDGCKQKVKKILQKVDGVFQTAIDADQGIVTVSGNVDPATLIKKLNKAGKHAELLLPKGVNISHLQKPQLENQKAHHGKEKGMPLKPIPGGGAAKDPKGLATHLQQMKVLKDLKMPQLKFPFQKAPKSVKFNLPAEGDEDGSEYDDYDDDDDFDLDDEDVDEFDGFDADFADDFQNMKVKAAGGGQLNAPNAAMMLSGDKKNGKKGGVEIPLQFKGGLPGNNDAKNGKKGGGPANQNPGAGGKNAGKFVGGGGGSVVQDPRAAGNNAKKGGGGGGGGGGVGGGVGGGLKLDPAGFRGEPMGPPAGFPAGMNGGHMGHMPPAGHPAAAPHGLPPGMPPPGYYPGGGMPAMNPEMMAAAAAGGAGNPYQQQYLAAMMQQQRMMMNGQDRGYPPMMGYPRPAMPTMPPAMYTTQPPYGGEPYTNYFSDENANSCSIM